MTRIRRIRATVGLALTGLLLLPTLADATTRQMPHVPERLIGRPTPLRGTAGSSYTSLTTKSFRVAGSPYAWSFEVTQSRSGPGVPPDDPNLRIIAVRRASSGARPYQLHTWRFDLPAGSLRFNGELRHAGVDTGLLTAFGAIFMVLEDLSTLSTSKDRCPKTGAVVTKESSRRGVLRGSMTFDPGYVDPQIPDNVNITHVHATISRSRYTGVPCAYGNTCDPGKTLQATQSSPGGGNLINAGEAPGFSGLVFQQYEQDGVAEVSHALLGIGGAEVLIPTSTTVEVLSDIFGPFAGLGGSMIWTKSTKDIELTAKCKRTAWQLTGAAGSFDLILDSGDQTIAAPSTSGVFEVAKRR